MKPSNELKLSFYRLEDILLPECKFFKVDGECLFPNYEDEDNNQEFIGWVYYVTPASCKNPKDFFRVAFRIHKDIQPKQIADELLKAKAKVVMMMEKKYNVSRS